MFKQDWLFVRHTEEVRYVRSMSKALHSENYLGANIVDLSWCVLQTLL